MGGGRGCGQSRLGKGLAPDVFLDVLLSTSSTTIDHTSNLHSISPAPPSDRELCTPTSTILERPLWNIVNSACAPAQVAPASSSVNDSHTMASPAAPLTPPAEPGSTQTLSQQHTQSQTQLSTQAQSSTQNTTGSANSRVEALLAQPLTSLTDDGSTKRPRDHRLIHLLLASHGINAYQERVPLQLMDFAYRYTSAILSDALHMQQEGYDQADNASGSKKGGNKSNASKSEEGDISVAALRMAIQSRMAHQFTGQGNLPKEFLKSLADERNRISLQQQAKDDKSNSGVTIGGIKLPHERYCLTGMGWGLKNEWESEGEESDGDEEIANAAVAATDGDDMQLDDAEEAMDEEGEGGTMEDVFGADDGDKDGDAEMEG